VGLLAGRAQRALSRNVLAGSGIERAGELKESSGVGLLV